MEYGVDQSITSSRGTITLNDLDDGAGLALPAGNGYLLQVVRGNIYPTIRNPVDNRPGKHGGIVHPFFKGPKIIEFEGLIVATTPTHRQTLSDHMLKVTDPLLEENGTYAWSPPSPHAARSHTVRLMEPVSIVGVATPSGMNAAPKTFSFTLIVGATDVEAG